MANDEGGLSLDRFLAGYNSEEKAKAVSRELEQLLAELLGVADALHDLEQHCAALERKGLQGVPRKSVEVVLRKLVATLKAHRVEPMDSKGQLFDPRKHEVFETRSVPGGADDVVMEELVHGYTWNDRVLRHGKVIISRGEPIPEAEGRRAKRRQRGRKRASAQKGTKS
jgi:molecular chaperone GrpE